MLYFITYNSRYQPLLTPEYTFPILNPQSGIHHSTSNKNSMKKNKWQLETWHHAPPPRLAPRIQPPAWQHSSYELGGA